MPRKTGRLRFSIILALLATALGGAYIAFDLAGGFDDPFKAKTESPTTPTLVIAKDKPQSAQPPEPVADDHLAAGPSDDDDEKDGDAARSLDPKHLDSLLPQGITRIDGMGGKGFARQVKSGGVWYPVFNLAQAKKADGTDLDPSKDPLDDPTTVDPNTVTLTSIDLAIVSPNPTAARVGKKYAFAFQAIGGKPPYRWAMQMAAGAGEFFIDANTGTLQGVAAKPVSTTLSITVTDAEGTVAQQVYTLVVEPVESLSITTTSLPWAIIDQAYTATFNAVGGVPPYSWSVSGLDESWGCNASLGKLTGMPTEAGEYTAQVTVKDAQNHRKVVTLPLKITSGLDITTASPLLPASPGGAYSLQFTASGGAGEYHWRLASGALPPGWVLANDGTLSGIARDRESNFFFTLQVIDSSGLTFRKAFTLAIRKSLIAVPSRQRVGLAWQPSEIMRIAAAPVVGISIARHGPDGLVEVYRGTGSNVVDHAVQTGASYDYTLTAHSSDGRAVPIASAHVNVLPMSLQRGALGIRGDPFADRVSRFEPLSPGGYGANALPLNVTGPPDGRSTFSPASAANQVASLHAAPGAGGSIVLEFTDNIIELGPGLDFTVFENVFFMGGDSNKRFMEPAIVEVALFEGQWYRFATNINPPSTGAANLNLPSYYTQGFAGVNATTGEDPTDPTRSGGDSFDANALGAPDLTWIRFIRIQSTGDNAIRDAAGQLIEHRRDLGATSGNGSSGFDLDAVSAVNY